jgi:serine protease inhibitor
VQHKTFVHVDEEGTKAAAAAGVDVHATAARHAYNVVVARPFLFVIADTATGATPVPQQITIPPPADMI